MSLVLGIDVETTGLDNTTDQVIEVAAVLWDWEKGKPVKMVSEIIDPWINYVERPKLDPFITKLTGITDDDITLYGRDIKDVIAEIEELNLLSSHFVAHNAEFDRGFLLPHNSMFNFTL